MNLQEEILKLVIDFKEQDIFIVDLTISSAKKITLLIDSDKGITIKDCSKISRHILKSFEEKLDEYEINVSSPGIGQAFMVEEQYFKNVGNDVELLLNNGEKQFGKLIGFENNIIKIEESKKVQNKNSKKKETVIKAIEFDEKIIKSTKLVVKFK